MLTNLSKDDNQSMDEYLRTVKSHVDSMLAIRSFLLTWNRFSTTLLGCYTCLSIRVLLVLTLCYPLHIPLMTCI